MENEQVFHDLDERIGEKVRVLDRMAENATDPSERLRLHAKAEGVGLAQSLLHEVIRSRGAVRYERTADGWTTTFHDSDLGRNHG